MCVCVCWCVMLRFGVCVGVVDCCVGVCVLVCGVLMCVDCCCCVNGLCC